MNDWCFCVNNILLAKPSVSYFCPAKLQSLIGTAVLANANHIAPMSICPTLYICNVSCLAWCLYLKITATAEQTLTLLSFFRNVCHLVAPLPGSGRLYKHLMAILISILFIVQPVVVKLPLYTLTLELVYIT